MIALLDRAQIERVGVLAADDVAEAIHIERARGREIGDAELDMARAHDVEGRIEDGIAQGHVVSSLPDGGATLSLKGEGNGACGSAKPHIPIFGIS